MLSQLATRVTVSMAFLAAAMVFSPYPLLDQEKGASAPQTLLPKAEHFADSSKHFAADVSRQTKDLERASLDERAQQVEGFRTSVLEAVQDKEPAAEDSFTQHVKSKIKESVSAARHHVSHTAEKVGEAGTAAFDAAKDSAASSIEKLEEAASSVAGEAQELKQDGVEVAHSAMGSLENAVGAATDEVKEGVQKSKNGGQGLKEKLEAVTAHIRESTSWPEPEAINIMAEGVWAPKEQNPLPNLSKFLDPDRVHIRPDHKESSLEEKLGIHEDSSEGFMSNSSFRKTVNRLLSPVVNALRVAGGPFYAVGKAAATPARLKVVHLLGVLLHLGVALWLFQTECIRVLRKVKIAPGGAWRWHSVWVEAACSLLALVTFLFLFPWAKSGPEERNEVQVLAGTAAESLVRLLWRGASAQKASGSLDASSGPPTPTDMSSPSSEKRSKKQEKKARQARRKSAEATEDAEVAVSNQLCSDKYGLSAIFSLVTRLSVVVALSFHLSFLSSWFRAK